MKYAYILHPNYRSFRSAYLYKAVLHSIFTAEISGALFIYGHYA